MRRTLAVTTFLVASCLVAWGQTSIEYSTLGSGAATGISKAGGTASNALGEVGKRLSNAVGSPSTPSPTQPSPSVPDTMRSNRQQFEKQAQEQGCGNLHISSVPKQATLVVDHLAVAATPADLCVPVGKHTIELRARGFRTWTQEVTITAGQALSLAPTLSQEKETKDYKRTVTVTF